MASRAQAGLIASTALTCNIVTVVLVFLALFDGRPGYHYSNSPMLYVSIYGSYCDA